MYQQGGFSQVGGYPSTQPPGTPQGQKAPAAVVQGTPPTYAAGGQHMQGLPTPPQAASGQGYGHQQLQFQQTPPQYAMQYGAASQMYNAQNAGQKRPYQG
eukprot:231501-Pyramimonas_sp.AAC.1